MEENELILRLANIDVVNADKVLLESVSLSLRAGEFVYLVGRTGSGKSSLLKAIYGEIPLRKGEGEICGVSIQKITGKTKIDLRRKLGMIFQEFRLFDEWSVHANLEFVLKATGWKEKKKRMERIESILNFVELTDKAGQRVSFLSGGEQQRLAIGRALLNKPKLLVADEPTGNLDPQTSDEIMYLLNNINKEHNTAILFATHDYRLIEKFPNKILRCEGGSLQVVNVA